MRQVGAAAAGDNARAGTGASASPLEKTPGKLRVWGYVHIEPSLP